MNIQDISGMDYFIGHSYAAKDATWPLRKRGGIHHEWLCVDLKCQLCSHHILVWLAGYFFAAMHRMLLCSFCLVKTVREKGIISPPSKRKVGISNCHSSEQGRPKQIKTRMFWVMLVWPIDLAPLKKKQEHRSQKQKGLAWQQQKGPSFILPLCKCKAGPCREKGKFCNIYKFKYERNTFSIEEIEISIFLRKKKISSKWDFEVWKTWKRRRRRRERERERERREEITRSAGTQSDNEREERERERRRREATRHLRKNFLFFYFPFFSFASEKFKEKRKNL